MAAFDPYHKWLGIPPAEQPVNHYRLLGVTLFESDPDVIDAATEQRVSYLRQCATGQHIAESQKLLNEVAAARLCLLNAGKKRKYDEQLHGSLTESTAAASSRIADSLPTTMPWEGADEEPASVADESTVPDFNATSASSKSNRAGSKSSPVLTLTRIAVAALVLGAILLAVAFRRGSDHSVGSQESQSISSNAEIRKSESEQKTAREKKTIKMAATPVVKPAEPAVSTNVPVASSEIGGDELLGEWQSDGRWLEIWRITKMDGRLQLKCEYLQGNTPIGSFTATDLAYQNGELRFIQVYEQKPDPTLRDRAEIFVKRDDERLHLRVPQYSHEGWMTRRSASKGSESPPTEVSAIPKPTDDRPISKVVRSSNANAIDLVARLRETGKGLDRGWELSPTGLEVGQSNAVAYDIHLNTGFIPPKEYRLRMNFSKNPRLPMADFVGFFVWLPSSETGSYHAGFRQLRSGTVKMGFASEGDPVGAFGKQPFGLELPNGLLKESIQTLEVEVTKSWLRFRYEDQVVCNTRDYPSLLKGSSPQIEMRASANVGLTIHRLEVEPLDYSSTLRSLIDEQGGGDVVVELAKAVETAIATRNTAQKNATAELLADIDREIKAVPKKKLDASAKTQMIQMLATERRAFENRIRIPFAPLLRRATMTFLKDYNATYKPVAKAYDAAISHFTRSSDDRRASALQQEKEDQLAPWVIGTWEINNPRKKLVHVLYSNGKIDQSDGKSRFEITFDKLTLFYDPPETGKGTWVTQCTISDDGTKMSAREQNGVTSPGQRVDNLTK